MSWRIVYQGTMIGLLTLAAFIIGLSTKNPPVIEGLTPEEVKVETTFDELDADSLDVFQVISEIEDEFDIQIETEEGLNTVGDLVAYVEEKTK